jgi:hypothetical protein
MEHIQLLRVKRLNRKDYGGNIIAVAARHNLRENLNELDHIDQSKTSQNVILRGSVCAADVAAKAVNLMEQAQLKPLRKNAVIGIEILFSLPPSSGIAELDFFTDAVAWAEIYFEIPILSAAIHNDENAPHCHVIMLPLFNGRMMGDALIGDRKHIEALQADFHIKVGQRYGLKRGTSAKRHSATARRKAADSIIDAMRKKLKGIDAPTFWDAMRDIITEAPAVLMAWFGIEYEKTKQSKKTFTSIMIQNKPERKARKPIGNSKRTKPIGIAAVISDTKIHSLCSVGFADSTPLVSPVDAPFQDDCVREREEDHAADYWNEVQGKFIKPPTKQKTMSAETERVRGAIMAIRL